MLLHIKPVGLFLVGFLVGSCAVAFVVGCLFFAVGTGSITVPWLSNRVLVNGITQTVGLLCGFVMARRYSK